MRRRSLVTVRYEIRHNVVLTQAHQLDARLRGRCLTMVCIILKTHQHGKHSPRWVVSWGMPTQQRKQLIFSLGRHELPRRIHVGRYFILTLEV